MRQLSNGVCRLMQVAHRPLDGLAMAQASPQRGARSPHVRPIALLRICPIMKWKPFVCMACCDRSLKQPSRQELLPLCGIEVMLTCRSTIHPHPQGDAGTWRRSRPGVRILWRLHGTPGRCAVTPNALHGFALQVPARNRQDLTCRSTSA